MFHASCTRAQCLDTPPPGQDNLIDRFDGRALLDFYRDPPPHVKNRDKGHQEQRVEEVRS